MIDDQYRYIYKVISDHARNKYFVIFQLENSNNPKIWTFYLTTETGVLIGSALGMTHQFGVVRVAELKNVNIRSKYRGLALCQPTINFIFQILFGTEVIDYLWIHSNAEKLSVKCYLAAGLHLGLHVAFSNQFYQENPILNPSAFQDMNYFGTIEQCFYYGLQRKETNGHMIFHREDIPYF